MTATLVMPGTRQIEVDIVSATQTSSNTDSLVTGSTIDAAAYRSVAYTVKVATNNVDWTVYGANQADLSDKIAVQAKAPVAAGAAGSYAVAQAPYRYYCVYIDSSVDGNHGAVTLAGIAKP
jgi:hypothetical protein